MGVLVMYLEESKYGFILTNIMYINTYMHADRHGNMVVRILDNKDEW